MQADSLKRGNPGSWTTENGNELQTARPTRAGVSDEVAQESQVISNGNANIQVAQVNFQHEISDPDECAKASNVTAMREAENRFLVEGERRETISSGESNAARNRFITSCGSPRDTTRQKLYG